MRNLIFVIKLFPMKSILNIPLSVLCMLGFAACENDLQQVNRLVKQDEVSIEKATGIEVLYSDSAQLKARVTAPESLHYMDVGKPRQTFPKGIRVDFYNGTKAPDSHLTAKYAERDNQTLRVQLRDSVIVWSPTERLETEELFWNEQQELITSDRLVKITTQDEVIYGKGFESNTNFTNWTIRQVTGRVRVKSLLNDEGI